MEFTHYEGKNSEESLQAEGMKSSIYIQLHK